MSSTTDQVCICAGQTFCHPDVRDLEIYYLGPHMEFGRATGLRFTRLMDAGCFLPPVNEVIPRGTARAYDRALFDQKAIFNFELVNQRPSADTILGNQLLITPVKKEEQEGEGEKKEGNK